MARRQGWTNLVITRREGENIVIGDPKNPIAVVHLASIKGDRVRICIETDRGVPVHREEIADQIVNGAADEKAKPAPPITSGMEGGYGGCGLRE